MNQPPLTLVPLATRHPLHAVDLPHFIYWAGPFPERPSPIVAPRWTDALSAAFNKYVAPMFPVSKRRAIR